jgi:hypothetical protein
MLISIKDAIFRVSFLLLLLLSTGLSAEKAKLPYSNVLYNWLEKLTKNWQMFLMG